METCKHEGQTDNNVDIEEDNDADDFSDISSDLDIFHARVDPDKSWTTEEDLELAGIDVIKERLRDRPLVPPRPGDPSADFLEVESGVKLPLLHCAFHARPART